MATPIKAVPILHGEAADDFVRQAEERERSSQRKSLTSEQEQNIAEMTRQLREFVPSWKKQ
jgi:hypothetical protein